MKRPRLVLTTTAKEQLLAIVAWWRQHRPLAPELFLREFTAAVRRLHKSPMVGTSFARWREHGIRRLLLARSRYWLYYRVEPQQARVLVVALWHTARGKPPPLG